MRKHPKFLPPNYGRKKRVKLRWRKPRGVDAKKRTGKKIMGASPRIGWRSPRDDRGFHPSGMMEVMVRSMKDIEALSGSKDIVVRLAATLGRRKREAVMAKAKSFNLRVLNPYSKG